MDVNTSAQFIKPSDCVLGFGVPTSKNNFLDDLHNPHKDFARQFNGLWSKYHFQFVRILEDIEPQLRELGLTIVHELTLPQFGALFKNKKVVILFSHWNENSIEFYDGLAKKECIVNQIPDDFSGIVDLCICHPDGLAELIRAKKTRTLVRYTSSKATPLFWLHFYLNLFRYLKEKDITYFDALEEVINEFFKTIGKSKVKKLNK